MATSAWHALAPELISEILRYAHPGLIPVLNPRDYPWHLGHICISWRAVFVSSTLLWNTLLIDLDSRVKDHRKIDPRPYDHALDIVNVCIQRSKFSPLKFTLWMSSPALYSSERTWASVYCHRILTVLITQSERWQEIDLSIGHPQLATLYSVRNKLSKLESVRLFLHSRSEGRKRWEQLRDKAYASLFATVPKLKRTDLMEHEAWRINWSSVTTIHLRELKSLKGFIATLRQTERLEELNISGAYYWIPCNITPIRLPYLKMLHCGTVDLLVLFITPELEELDISEDYDFSAEIESNLCQFFNALQHLQRLKLRMDFPRVPRLAFQHTPAVIQELSIYGFGIYEQLKEISRFPKACGLKVITLQFRSPYGCSKEEFIGMIRSWTKRDGAASGLGPFKNLNLFVMEMFNMQDPLYYLASYLNCLRGHLKEQKIGFIVRDIGQEDGCRPQRPFFTDSIHL